MPYKNTIAAVFCALALATTQFAQAVETPVVPVSVIEKAVSKPAVDKKQPEDALGGASTIKVPSILTVKPGVNELIPVSMRHINRLVTPFANPSIRTASTAETKIEQNVVYIVPDDETPITMFITEKGDPSVSMSLTLVPRKVPPIEVALKFDEATYSRQTYSGRAAEWERSQPYVQTLVSLLRGIALQQIPPGYTLGPIRSKDYQPVCVQDGFKFSFKGGQILRGHHFNVAIGTITNASDIPLEFIEAACADWTVAAVSSYPHVVLEPGQSSEIYIVSKTPDPSAPRIRPSLVNSESSGVTKK